MPSPHSRAASSAVIPNLSLIRFLIFTPWVISRSSFSARRLASAAGFRGRADGCDFVLIGLLVHQGSAGQVLAPHGFLACSVAFQTKLIGRNGCNWCRLAKVHPEQLTPPAKGPTHVSAHPASVVFDTLVNGLQDGAKLFRAAMHHGCLAHLVRYEDPLRLVGHLVEDRDIREAGLPARADDLFGPALSPVAVVIKDEEPFIGLAQIEEEPVLQVFGSELKKCKVSNFHRLYTGRNSPCMDSSLWMRRMASPSRGAQVSRIRRPLVRARTSGTWLQEAISLARSTLAVPVTILSSRMFNCLGAKPLLRTSRGSATRSRRSGGWGASPGFERGRYCVRPDDVLRRCSKPAPTRASQVPA